MYRGIIAITLLTYVSCQQVPKEDERQSIRPIVITEKVPHDTDDPAIWYCEENPSQSLVIGTDKEIGGGLYVFDLEGKIIDSLSIKGLYRPNNVDLAYKFPITDSTNTDIVVTSERAKQQLRFYSFPEMEPLDGGGFAVFEDETDSLLRLPMGVALYKSPKNRFFAFVSRKDGPSTGYVYQYEVRSQNGTLRLEFVRKLGAFSGKGEIEALMVDDETETLYYSDEQAGIKKYYADAEKGNEELALFGKEHFVEDREGIALWPKEEGRGYIIVSNQQDHSFNVFDRMPSGGNHRYLGTIPLSTVETDGCEIITDSLNSLFPKGMMVAMTEGKEFHYYDLRNLQEYMDKNFSP